MKTIIQASQDTGIPTALIRAVIKQIGGMESFERSYQDIIDHGIDCGFHGFSYHSETVSFFKRNKKAIIDLLERNADDFDMSVIDLCKSFNCLRDCTNRKIGETIYGRKINDEVANGLACFAAESVAYSFD